MVEKQFAAGGIVMKKEGESLKVLLIRDSYGHWIWPKGHIENRETPGQTAVREISEETGLKDLEIIEELGRQRYYFTLEGKKIFKTVHVFLVKAVPGEEFEVQTSEIDRAEWFSPEEALEAIEYEGSRVILEKGIRIFRKKSGQ
ncbi:MAG: NUDIX domain-containing protein [Candidatus Omnitrophota bacterium]|nr:NUDIX domain-containing protein [Candidatus Omnitrophota bacterium]